MTASRRPLFTLNPGRDTAIAALTLLALSGCYLLTSRTGQGWPLYVGIVIAGTVIPAWTVFGLLRESWSALGITRRWLKVSLVVSLLLGAGSAYQVMTLARAEQVDPVAHLVANLFVLWEAFFVFGWLYLRWEKAFGIIPAVLLVGVGFTVQHLGSVSLAQAIGFGAFAVVCAVPFVFTRNLLILWPLFYPVASGIGTLQAGIAFGWDAAIGNAVLAIAQTVIVVVIARRLTAASHTATSPAATEV